MRFLHIADVHLGFQQYGLPERFNDFHCAFDHAIQYGVTNKVDAILIAGDLFNKSVIEPMAYIQAADTLNNARRANIPVVAVAGNHDQARLRDQVSWLDVLAHEGYLHLLEPELSEETCKLPAWDKETCQGAYIDIQNVRIIGVPWLGASASTWLPEIGHAIARLPRKGTNFNILLTHAALEGEMSKVATYVTHDQLEPLRKTVDYMALGHLHKPFERDDWLYNPGSLEIYDVGELDWKIGGKSGYDVTVDQNGKKQIKRVSIPHRPFFRHDFSVGAYSKPADLMRSFHDEVHRWAADWRSEKEKPVVEISLEGELAFDRHEVDIQILTQLMQNEAELLHVLVNTSRLRSPGMEISIDEVLPQNQLERTVLKEIARSDSRFSSQADAWARVMLEIKQMALDKRDARDILDSLEKQMDQAEGE